MEQFPGFSFKVLKRTTGDPSWPNRARLGHLITPHGIINTPAFVFCATKGAVRGATAEQVHAEETQIILANTYHLMLQPGSDLVASLGGLHKMMGWNGPMLTDSGGFQIFSLGHGAVAEEIKRSREVTRRPLLMEVGEAGATFRSYIDGSVHTLTPETAIQVQRQLGADIMLVLDECTPYHVDKTETARSMLLTHRWAKRCVAEFEHSRDRSSVQALYGIVQGGVYEDLRQESADFTSALRTFGHAVGGCLGGSKAEMQHVVGMVMAALDDDKPVHLLGIGGIEDIWSAVAKGIDTFDCVTPTRLARHGHALIRPGLGEATRGRDHINLNNARFRADRAPLDTECVCYTCQTFSRAYLHHLLKAGEMLAAQLLAMHNISFMNRMLTDIRTAICQDRYGDAMQFWLGGSV